MKPINPSCGGFGERLASPELGRSERFQLTATAQRLEVSIGATRGKLEDAAPVVSTPNPRAHTLASLTGAGVDKVETGLILLVALLVEMGGGTVRYHEPCEGSETNEGSNHPGASPAARSHGSTPARAGNQALPRPLEPGQTSLAAGLRAATPRPAAGASRTPRRGFPNSSVASRPRGLSSSPSTAARRSSSLQPMSTAA